MNDLFVREISPRESPQIVNAKTGDRLPDGTILIWRQDMERMGLRQLRTWIHHAVVEESATIAVGDNSSAIHGVDEEYSG